ncbi:TlyA family RNA methyltransferase [Brachybacterium aquaticum]|uniref:23S rRNA (Cytidine1920-2'-O)/16S rRNA (Cytidine1409-2'-O)-methyltransferase n=1 Tax=Brachybacterium aquaticum TaxID=1432564 RepID=A0A841AEC2_9MICO|nr:TlyA family RNA methyltransferase [Brachybacterium aquaticum]MBB5831685.1 23S rRNA (cytidine1920-2'-O)/16S rRNA (cytidine1409-2'-O)-methyltransferase [Brachybacterium aquaticum]
MSEDRLDVALLAVGLARSRTHARRIVEEGRARLDGRPVTKPSHPVPAGAALSVVDVPDGIEYASRAAHKLAGALDTLGLSPQGATCLDAGASTGGFTDVLLRRGAASVHAVDIGHDQLAAHVREDPRVVVRDGTSVRDLTEELLGTRVDLVVADLSFISLRTVLEPLAGVVREDGDLLLMVKPQFEVGRRALPKSGVVSDPAERVRAVREVVGTAAEHGLRLEAVGPSSLPGQDGNREYFVHLRPVRTGEGSPAPSGLLTGEERTAPSADGPRGPGAPGPTCVPHEEAYDMIGTAVRGDVPRRRREPRAPHPTPSRTTEED